MAGHVGKQVSAFDTGRCFQPLFGHVDAFDRWAAEMTHAGDVDALVGYRDTAPGALIAHPTADHFVPLLLTMGAADDPSSARTVFDRFVFSNHIRSFSVD